MYRWIFAVTLALGLGWAGLWFQASSALKSDIATWFEDRRAEGWQAEYDSLSVRGFPSRLDATLNGIRISDPSGSISWQAPFFQILGLSYRPGHKILAFPASQTLTLPSGPVSVISENMRASLVHDAEGRLLRANLEASRFSLDAPIPVSLTDLRAGLQEIAAQRAQYRLGVAALSADSARSTDDIQVQAEITFDRKWTLEALSRNWPRMQALDLRQGSLGLDRQGFNLSGKLSMNAGSQASGTLRLRAQDPAALLDSLRPLLPFDWIARLEAVDLTGPLDIPLALDGGQISPGEPPLP